MFVLIFSVPATPVSPVPSPENEDAVTIPVVNILSGLIVTPLPTAVSYTHLTLPTTPYV